MRLVEAKGISHFNAINYQNRLNLRLRTEAGHSRSPRGVELHLDSLYYPLPQARKVSAQSSCARRLFHLGELDDDDDLSSALDPFQSAGLEHLESLW